MCNRYAWEFMEEAIDGPCLYECHSWLAGGAAVLEGFGGWRAELQLLQDIVSCWRMTAQLQEQQQQKKKEKKKPRSLAGCDSCSSSSSAVSGRHSSSSDSDSDSDGGDGNGDMAVGERRKLTGVDMVHTRARTHAHALTCSRTHTLTHSHALSLSHTHALTHTRTHMLSLTHTHTHTHTYTHNTCADQV